MSEFELRKLSVNDGQDIYEMLQEIPESENGYANPVNGKNREEYKAFLDKRFIESQLTELIDGWKVPSTKYWLYVDGKPVGMGDIRHFLTDALKKAGGNIGYSIRPSERGKGYGNKILELLVAEARKMGMERLLVTAIPSNEASISVARANGGVIENQTEERVWIWVPVTGYTDVSLEGEDIILKKAVFEDWEKLYHNLWKHEESAKYMLWTPTKSEEEAKDRMLRTISFERVWKYTFLIYLKETGEPIGHAGMREEEPGCYTEMGVAIGPEFIRKGYGKQVLNLLTGEAKRMGATKFTAANRATNIASRELQKACGFSFDHLSEEKTDPRTGEKYYVEFNIKNL